MRPCRAGRDFFCCRERVLATGRAAQLQKMICRDHELPKTEQRCRLDERGDRRNAREWLRGLRHVRVDRGNRIGASVSVDATPAGSAVWIRNSAVELNRCANRSFVQVQRGRMAETLAGSDSEQWRVPSSEPHDASARRVPRVRVRWLRGHLPDAMERCLELRVAQRSTGDPCAQASCNIEGCSLKRERDRSGGTRHVFIIGDSCRRHLLIHSPTPTPPRWRERERTQMVAKPA